METPAPHILIRLFKVILRIAPLLPGLSLPNAHPDHESTFHELVSN